MSSANILPEVEKLLSDWWGVSSQHEYYLALLSNLKKATDDNKVKNHAWVYSTLLEGHFLYLEIFGLLAAEEFYQAWCKLERLEILLANLRSNREYVNGDFGQSFLNNAVNSWQLLYPYKLFFSSREIIKKMSCSICHTPRSVLQGCRHRRGKLYAGELCNDVVEDFELITYDLVSNPVIKASVPFNSEIDHYDYSALRAALQIVETPREWFSAFKQGIPLAKHTGVHSPTFPCPCMRSIRNYEDCCMALPTTETDHIIFDVLSPRRPILSKLHDSMT
ncbi:SecC motif-containing protein [Pseudomonas sp. IT-P74]|uniref:SecC motif-containing protein n=1 Tax=unclassified Pseudomonas TaxID=196821 RepID=UPI000CD0B874|nr:SecC motif-containing protein [Pseudomonas sp. FW300-N1A1]POA17265.1 SecC motif-containing protein [Pseudomonas sp. FW300-N1A1]